MNVCMWQYVHMLWYICICLYLYVCKCMSICGCAFVLKCWSLEMNSPYPFIVLGIFSLFNHFMYYKSSFAPHHLFQESNPYTYHPKSSFLLIKLFIFAGFSLILSTSLPIILTYCKLGSKHFPPMHKPHPNNIKHSRFVIE